MKFAVKLWVEAELIPLGPDGEPDKDEDPIGVFEGRFQAGYINKRGEEPIHTGDLGVELEKHVRADGRNGLALSNLRYLEACIAESMEWYDKHYDD